MRRSRFLTQTCQADSREASREFVEYIRRLHPDATHNCWAFVAGPPGDTALIGSSDDGEPKGTAGRPMLGTLLHCGIGQICVVVSRWFGGIKLGTGGLVRAYQDAVSENLKTLPLASAVPETVWKLESEYAWLPAIQRLLPEFEARVESEEYGAVVELVIRVPVDRAEALKPGLAQISNGQARLVPM